MARQEVENGDTGLLSRQKINNNDEQLWNGENFTQREVNTNTTLLTTDDAIIADGAIELTLPDATTAYKLIYIRSKDDVVTVLAAGADDIEVEILPPNHTAVFASVGTEWIILGGIVPIEPPLDLRYLVESLPYASNNSATPIVKFDESVDVEEAGDYKITVSFEGGAVSNNRSIIAELYINDVLLDNEYRSEQKDPTNIGWPTKVSKVTLPLGANDFRFQFYRSGGGASSVFVENVRVFIERWTV
jgi:hypothetical protein